jgi:hypothetical protein
MKNPNIKTKVLHSETNNAWNVIGTSLAKKFKIARVPYVVNKNLSKEEYNKKIKEAENIAEFISECFNNSEKIIELLKPAPVIEIKDCPGNCESCTCYKEPVNK